MGSILSDVIRELGQGFLLRKTPGIDHSTGPFRRQIEGFAIAIAMALILKQFTFDTFQVPTESMEPTIIGRGDLGDRVLVDRYAYLCSDPSRYDIVVFKYPLSRLVNYVKRAVGLPGELLKIWHGQIYAAPSGTRDFRITRKPDGIQEAILANNPVIPSDETTNFTGVSFFKHWQSDGAPEFTDGSVKLTARSGSEVHVSNKNPITDVRLDPWADGAKGRSSSGEAVGDLRVAIDVYPESAETIIIEIGDPQQPGQPIRLECAVDGSAAVSRVMHGTNEVKADGATLASKKLPKNAKSRVVLDNIDQRIRVRIDGDLVLSWDYSVAPVESLAVRQTTVAVGIKSGTARFARLAINRDTHYTRFDGITSEFNVPPGHYLMLGDNSPNSLDARGWRRSMIRIHGRNGSPDRVLTGDFEAVSDRLESTREMTNPYHSDRTGKDEFVDVEGNLWRLEPGSWDLLDAATGAPRALAVTDVRNVTDIASAAVFDHFTPREFVVGRAAIVFFPFTRMGMLR